MQPPSHNDDEVLWTCVFWVPVAMDQWKPSLAAKAWATVKSDIALPSALLFSRHSPSAGEWFSLWMNHKWSMPRPPCEDTYRDGRRQIWMNVEGALVKRSDATKLMSE